MEEGSFFFGVHRLYRFLKPSFNHPGLSLRVQSELSGFYRSWLVFKTVGNALVSQISFKGADVSNREIPLFFFLVFIVITIFPLLAPC